MNLVPDTCLLRPHDRIVFLGDSITEQQLYTNYVETYLASRYPDWLLTFFNAGWGGDTALGGGKRLQRDVLTLQPTVVTICYGMNDGAYTPLTEEIRHNFIDGMRALVARLQEAGVRVVLLTPSMADERFAAHYMQAANYNRHTLRVFADDVLALAAEQGLPVCDIHALMNAVHAKAVADDPQSTLVPDSIHPNPAGHLVIAHGLLQALGVPPRQQSLAINLADATITASDGVRIEHLRYSAHGLSFDLQLDRLPFFVEEAARTVLPYLPFQEAYNTLPLTIDDLPGERGYLRSQNARGASATRAEFAGGVNLFADWQSDLLRQAEAVGKNTTEKALVYYKLWRWLGLVDRIDLQEVLPSHQIGITISPALDRARDVLLAPVQPQHCHLVCAGEAREELENGEFISQWACRGPIAGPYSTDALGGEADCSIHLPACDSAWQSLTVNLSSLGNVLSTYYDAAEHCFAYALSVLDSPEEQHAELLLGSNDGIAAWLNGEALLDHLHLKRGVQPDQERLPIHLHAGENILLLKISLTEGDWGFCARFAGLRMPIVVTNPIARLAVPERV